MAMFANKGSQESLTEINITPLVDVMLVLLIVFMVTAPLLQQGLPVNLPEAKAPAIKRTKKDLIVTVQSNGKIFIGEDKTEIPIKKLEAELKGIFFNNKEKDLFIKADSELQYGTVIKIMALGKRAGANRIGMLTQPEKGS